MKERTSGLVAKMHSKAKNALSVVLSTALLISALSVPLVSVLTVSAAETEAMSEYLTLHYTFDNAKEPGEDASGNKKTGSFSGKVSQTEGKVQNGLYFNSSSHGQNDAYGQMPMGAVKHNAITLMAWVKYDIETVGSYARIFALEAGDGKTLHLMANNGDAHQGYVAEIYTSGSSKKMVLTEGMIPNAVYEDWHHVAVTYDGTELKLFVNGAFIHDVKVTSKLSSWSIQQAFLGKTGRWNNGSYNGYMDEVRVYSKALTEEEIALVSGTSLDESLSAVKLLSSLKIDGEELSEFNRFAEDYYRVLPDGTTTVPEVTAEPPCEGATVEVVPATSIPGTTEVEITYPGGAKRTVTVKFTASDVTLAHPEIKDVTIDDPFWNEKLKNYCEVTAPYVLKTWVSKTLDNLRNFDKVARGHRNTGDYVGSMTWGESDFYAAMAGACRLLQHYPNESLENLIDEYVDHIFAASESVDNGYFGIYNLLMTNGKVFGEAPNPAVGMDLFCLGYLMELGIAHYEAVGDARMLRVALRYLNFTVEYSNHGKRNFVSFHTGVEYNLLALVEYLQKKPEVLNHELLKDLDCNVDDYLELAYHFLAYRGVHTNRVNNAIYGSYGSDHIPYTQLRTAAGHIVESVLYYWALADYGRQTGELTTTNAAYRLWENVVNKQMYVTGGCGSVYSYEGFGGDYHLPNESYTESCTSGALIQYSDTLSLMFTDSRYHDVVEQALYNNFLGSIGANGTTFFYTNPLTDNASSRYTWHAVPCCTKYGLLLFGDMPRFLYSYSDTDVYVNQYIGNTASLKLAGGTVTLKQTANWAEEGVASVTVSGGAAHLDALYLRLPEWSGTTTVLLNGEAVSYETVNGYAVIRGDFKDGDTVSLTADMSVQRVYDNENVTYNAGHVAIQKGPFIYCMEGIDNPATEQGQVDNWLILSEDCQFTEKRIEDLYGGVTALTTEAKLVKGDGKSEPYTLTLIPFYARSNRGTSTVRVWLKENPEQITNSYVDFGDSVELKELGAEYTGTTNATKPTGSGSKNIAVIVDGVTAFRSDGMQYDSFGATLSDSLGKKKIVWYGVRFDQEFGVSHVVFWEGGHWNNGGWFGETPTVQVMINKKWVDVSSTISKAYPGDSQALQLPTNEAYVFTLSEPVVCRAVRIVGKQNTAAGHHVSCSEIEVFGMKAEDVPTSPDTTNNVIDDTDDLTTDTGMTGEKPAGLSDGVKALLVIVAGVVSMAVTYVVMRIIKKKGETS